MTTEDKFVMVIARLNALTQDGKLKWRSHPHPDLGDFTKKFIIVGQVFGTDYKNKDLRIFEHSVKQASSNFEDRFKGSKKPLKLVPTLIFVDVLGNVEWEFPLVPGLKDLFKSVQYQDAGIDKFINEILDDELFGIDENEDS